jgi:hypothetical protein
MTRWNHGTVTFTIPLEGYMRISSLAASSLAFILSLSAAALAAPTSEPARIAGPVINDNLAVYFIHGPSKSGPVPLTLGEALNRKVVEVRETGNVNALEIENFGDQPVFVQAGDVVKGGRQDRTLMVSLVLPPKSGRIPIASFCVEHGRWSGRAKEDVTKFSSSFAAVPSREMKLAMQAPKPSAPGYRGLDTGSRQQEVWDGVQKAQDRLSAATGGEVRAAASATSLQLALENEKLAKLRAGYVEALKAAGESGDDIVGYVFAVNGKLNSGEVYESNGLFRKMWPKLLDASATEAISHRNEAVEKVPSVKAVTAYLDAGNAGKESVAPLNFGVSRVTRESEQNWQFETANAGGWVHRSYLSK